MLIFSNPLTFTNSHSLFALHFCFIYVYITESYTFFSSRELGHRIKGLYADSFDVSEVEKLDKGGNQV